jgi:hypothetical protein
MKLTSRSKSLRGRSSILGGLGMLASLSLAQLTPVQLQPATITADTPQAVPTIFPGYTGYTYQGCFAQSGTIPGQIVGDQPAMPAGLMAENMSASDCILACAVLIDQNGAHYEYIGIEGGK